VRLIGVLLLTAFFPTPLLQAQGVSDPCATFCIRLASEEQRPGYTIEKIHGGIETVWVSRRVEMGVEIVKGAEYVHDPYGAPAVLLHFTDAGQASMLAFSASNIRARIAIYVGGELLMVPVIMGRISDDRVLIEGVFSEEEAKSFVSKLNQELSPD